MNTLLIALLLVSPHKHRQNSAMRTFSGLYGKVAAAYRRRDVKSILSLATPNFKVKLYNGQIVGRAEAEQVIRRQMATFKEIRQYEISVLSAKIKGTKAVVRSATKVDVVFTDQNKNRHSIVQSSQGEDEWVKTPDGWKVAISRELKRETKMDGKPVQDE